MEGRRDVIHHSAITPYISKVTENILSYTVFIIYLRGCLSKYFSISHVLPFFLQNQNVHLPRPG